MEVLLRIVLVAVACVATAYWTLERFAILLALMAVLLVAWVVILSLSLVLKAALVVVTPIWMPVRFVMPSRRVVHLIVVDVEEDEYPLLIIRDIVLCVATGSLTLLLENCATVILTVLIVRTAEHLTF